MNRRILVRDTKDVYRHQVKKYIGKDGTVDDVLDYLFGKYGEPCDADFVIRAWSKDSHTRLQRLNMFWAVPLTMCCMPFQYVMKGKTGWDTTTKFGRWILKVTGNLREQ